jgi:transposase
VSRPSIVGKAQAVLDFSATALVGMEWLAKISEAGVRRRAELYYVQFDTLAALRQGVRRELLAESRKHPATRLLRQIPSIGPIRAALLVALIQTPNRFRTKRQLWAYCGLALRTGSKCSKNLDSS